MFDKMYVYPQTSADTDTFSAYKI